MQGLLLACAGLASTAPAHSVETLKLATWNLEWLMTTATFDSLARTCLHAYPGGVDRTIPCDIVEPPRSLRRTDRDFGRLREYGRRVDADVIALQEVDGPGAAALVFPDHALCFTRRRHVQNVGFAVRRGLPFECDDYPGLALGGEGLRRGAELTLFPRTDRTIRLLAVHLKSGCPQQLLSNRREECRQLTEQVAVLERWIDARGAEGTPFAVMGDFNRRFARERHTARDPRGRLIAMWPELDDGDPAEADLTNVTAGRHYRPCRPGTRHQDFIDHIVLSRTLAANVVPGSFRQITFDREDTRGARLSDHCPIAVEVKW